MIDSFIVLILYLQNVVHFVLTHLPQVPHICVGKLGQHWRMVGAKPLIEPMLEYLFIEPLEANYRKIIFVQENAFENIVCELVDILSRKRWVKQWIARCNNSESGHWAAVGEENAPISWSLLVSEDLWA